MFSTSSIIALLEIQVRPKTTTTYYILVFFSSLAVGFSTQALSTVTIYQESGEGIIGILDVRSKIVHYYIHLKYV